MLHKEVFGITLKVVLKGREELGMEEIPDKASHGPFNTTTKEHRGSRYILQLTGFLAL